MSPQRTAIVIVASTRAAAGIYEDRTGPVIVEWLGERGFDVPAAVVAADGQVLGVVSEAFVRKRYAEELDKRQRELMGERVEDTD